MTFKYNGKIWNPKNPEKKLKQLGITWDDVEIIEEKPKEVEVIEYRENNYYYFLNPKTNESITSIYPEIPSYIKNSEEYELTTLGTLEEIWSKTRKLRF